MHVLKQFSKVWHHPIQQKAQCRQCSHGEYARIAKRVSQLLLELCFLAEVLVQTAKASDKLCAFLTDGNDVSVHGLEHGGTFGHGLVQWQALFNAHG